MRDEKNGVPETLDSIGEKIAALAKSVDARFAQVDTRFDEVKAQLGAKIEAVDANVKLVYDVVIAQNAKNKANDDAHTQFTKRLDDHDTRILALESPKPRPASPDWRADSRSGTKTTKNTKFTKN